MRAIVAGLLVRGFERERFEMQLLYLKPGSVTAARIANKSYVTKKRMPIDRMRGVEVVCLRDAFGLGDCWKNRVSSGRAGGQSRATG
jgi:hypothetical protein